jgi:hypothetical protein
VDDREERVRGGELRIEFDRAFKQRPRLRVRLPRRSLPQRAAAEVAIVGFDVIGPGGGDTPEVADVENILAVDDDSIEDALGPWNRRGCAPLSSSGS